MARVRGRDGVRAVEVQLADVERERLMAARVGQVDRHLAGSPRREDELRGVDVLRGVRLVAMERHVPSGPRTEYEPSPAVVAVRSSGLPLNVVWMATETPASGSPLCASVTVPATAPKSAGMVTVRVTSTGTWVCFGAFVTNTTSPW